MSRMRRVGEPRFFCVELRESEKESGQGNRFARSVFLHGEKRQGHLSGGISLPWKCRSQRCLHLRSLRLCVNARRGREAIIAKHAASNKKEQKLDDGFTVFNLGVITVAQRGKLEGRKVHAYETAGGGAIGYPGAPPSRRSVRLCAWSTSPKSDIIAG